MRAIFAICVLLGLSSVALADESGDQSTDPNANRVVLVDGHEVMPQPDVAAYLHQSGNVVLNAQSDWEGHILYAAVVSSSGYPILDAAALVEALRWSFPPLPESARQGRTGDITVEFPSTSDQAPVAASAWPDDLPLLDPQNADPEISSPVLDTEHPGGHADYPVIARRLSWSGTAVIEIVIGADGVIENARIDQSSGFPLLDAEGLTAIGQWHYKPATKGGVPVAVREKVQFAFNLRSH